MAEQEQTWNCTSEDPLIMDNDVMIDITAFDKEDPNLNSFQSSASNNEVIIEVGMEFDSIAEIEELYANYGKNKGFCSFRRNTRANIVQLACHRGGNPRTRNKTITSNDEFQPGQSSRSSKSSKTGCKASLYCSKDSHSNKWRITKFNSQHNHEMVSPESRKYLRTHKKVTKSMKNLSEVFNSRGLSVGRVSDVMSDTPDDCLFTQKDCSNHTASVRKQALKPGDAQSMYLYCIHEQERSPEFRYSIQVDSEGRLSNIFWIDARSRMAYKLFGDTVNFDTIYKINKYEMSFAPFVGIDNHMHTILFGCALLQDETEDTFIWLFNVWLHAMDGKYPQTFITDQDAAVMNAVSKVFPNTKHRLCLWHITEKFPERLSHVYHDKTNFKVSLNNCIYESLSTAIFEELWCKLLNEFNLESNEWLQNLYSVRHLWVPIFCRNVFFGGMNTTGRSESINAFFDAFVKSGTSLKDFMVSYGKAIDRRYEDYRRAEFESRNKNPRPLLNMKLEQHAASIYTSEIFKLVQTELASILSYNREVVVKGNPIQTYRVSNTVGKSYSVLVQYNMTTNGAHCECLLFEFKGIVCRHILSLFYVHNVTRIPEDFILKRWTKDVGQILWAYPSYKASDSRGSVRYLKLSASFADLCDMSEKSETVFEFINNEMEIIRRRAAAKLNLSDENS